MATEKELAVKEYKTADDSQRAILEKIFGKQAFMGKITDRIKTFEDACATTGRNARAMIEIWQKNGDSKDEIAYKKLKIITKVLNEDYIPDWNNENEYKYFPWFKMGSGFGFSLTYFDGAGTFADLGSRLCFKSRELAEYAGTQFESIYKDLLTQ